MLGRARRGQRQTHQEARTLSLDAFHRDFAAVQRDHHFHQVESDAGADDALDVAAAVIAVTPSTLRFADEYKTNQSATADAGS